MKLAKYLANLGYGSRADTARMLEVGRVTLVGGRRLRDGDAAEHADIRLDGSPLDPPPNAVLMLHKPLDYVCSTKDVAPLVYELLPPRFLLRSPLLATVGRLDRDTSGLLLLTDDGALNHRLTSPRHHVAKRYEVQLATPLRGDEGEAMASGTLLLAGERSPLLPAELEVLGPQHARLTLHEGRYHQVRRMFAALGNHVEQLHRASFGPLTLTPLELGAWRLLTTEERALLEAPRAAPPSPKRP